MRLLQALLVVIPFCLPGIAQAQRSPVVVELFTSQGCSACPPADAILHDIAQRPGVIALALHVDYWDYLGWQDSFGQAAHTKRQRAYAKAAKERSIYTPQMIVQGVDRVVGADRNQVIAHIDAHQSRPAKAMLRLDRRDGVLRIAVAPSGPDGSGASEIHVVRFVSGGTVSVERGENAGHDLSFTNAVTDWSAVVRWDGRSEAEFEVALSGPEPVAVIVQRERLGPVLTAAQLP